MEEYPAGTAAFFIQEAVPHIERLPHCFADCGSRLFINAIFSATGAIGAKLGGYMDIVDENDELTLDDYISKPKLIYQRWSNPKNQSWLREKGLFHWEPSFFMLVDAKIDPSVITKLRKKFWSINDNRGWSYSDTRFPPTCISFVCSMIDSIRWMYTAPSENLNLGVLIASPQCEKIVVEVVSTLQKESEPIYRLHHGEISPW